MNFRLVQMNPIVGDIQGNATKILDAARAAANAHADVVLFPELALCGCPPNGLLRRPAFMEEVNRRIATLIPALPPDLLTIFGAPQLDHGHLYNSAILIHDGQRLAVAHKRIIPCNDLFEERRLYTPGTTSLLLTYRGVRLAIHIGSDSDLPKGPAFAGLSGHCDVLLNLSADPYSRLRSPSRESMARATATTIKAPFLCTNLVGGQDEWVFDGGGMAVTASGEITARAPLFCEGSLDVTLASLPAGTTLAPLPGTLAPKKAPLEEIYDALCLGIRDYTLKNHFPGVLIALSGGIDSALVAALACDALGPTRVTGVTLPSAITSDETLSDALELARRLHIHCWRIPIAPAVDAFSALLETARTDAPWATPLPGTLMEENLQARVRGVLVMALSNRYGPLVLTTGNKSEVATGYSTLYGDMCGGFAPIKDISKTLVFDLTRWRNTQSEVIPPSTLTRPPTAELRTGQKDSDSLPPYPILDPLLERYIDRRERVADLIASGLEETLVRRVVQLVNCSEYKRRQSAPGIHLTPETLNRRLPLTHTFRE